MYEDEVMATGFGSYMALPLMRKAGSNLTKEEAKKVLEDCLRVDYCRNCRATDMVRFAPEKLCGAAKKERTGFCEAFREEENGGREGLGAR
eukprot:1847558-Rhodomonas_salina.1